jgi:hypothetical protein
VRLDVLDEVQERSLDPGVFGVAALVDVLAAAVIRRSRW